MSSEKKTATLESATYYRIAELLKQRADTAYERAMRSDRLKARGHGTPSTNSRLHLAMRQAHADYMEFITGTRTTREGT